MEVLEAESLEPKYPQASVPQKAFGKNLCHEPPGFPLNRQSLSVWSLYPQGSINITPVPFHPHMASFCLCMRQESLGLQPAMNPVCSHSKALPSLCPQRPYSQRWLYWEALGEHGFWEEFLQFTTDGYSWKEWLCVYCLHCIIVNSRHTPLPQCQAHSSSSSSGPLGECFCGTLSKSPIFSSRHTPPPEELQALTFLCFGELYGTSNNMLSWILYRYLSFSI